MCFRLLSIFGYDFQSDCHISLTHGIAIRYVQHCQAMLQRGVCELAYLLSFNLCYLGFQRLQHVRALFPFTVNPVVKDGKRSGEGIFNAKLDSDFNLV